MANIYDVAEYFLGKANMTHKKLQKLCYYAEAWHLAIREKPLTDAEYEAWVHGPVERKLFTLYKGQYNISETSTEHKKHLSESGLTREQKELLGLIWNIYGEKSGEELEQMTHQEIPWNYARGSLMYWEPSESKINKEIMRDYYKSLLRK